MQLRPRQQRFEDTKGIIGSRASITGRHIQFVLLILVELLTVTLITGRHIQFVLLILVELLTVTSLTGRHIQFVLLILVELLTVTVYAFF